MDKKATILLAAVLLTAVLPLTAAHLTGSSTTSQLATGDNCRWEGFWMACAGSGGVSGTYVAGPEALFATGGAAFPLAVGGVGTVFAPGYFASAWVLCDLEVLGDGATRSPLDEERVDDDPNDPPGQVDDGTWDDGGVGGACHTEWTYEIDGWNMAGCGTGGTHAVAEDKVSGGDVWIGAACDHGSAWGSTPASPTACLINEVVSGAPDPVPCLLPFLPEDSGLALLDPYGGGASPPVISCGSDGIADTINYGPGGGSGSLYGVPYSALPFCDPSEGTSFVSVHRYVTAGGNPDHPPGGDPALVPATTGWIDSRNLASYGPATYGPGTSVPGPTGCSDLEDNDGDGRTDASDSGCQTQVGSLPVYNPLDGNE